jgi:activating signal cointegrator complex subunit 3
MKYENYSLLIDTHLIVQNSIRLLRCMLEMAIKKNQASVALKLLSLCKLVENRMAMGYTPLQQFSREIFTGYNSRKLHRDSKEGYLDQHWIDRVNDSQIPLYELDEMGAKELSYILNCSTQATKTFQKFIHYLPRIEATITIKPIA